MIGQLTNHLLQSTLFALAAALLVLAFRRNRARIRYSLWLAASLKFLIPFSMLIALGSQIHWTPAAHAIAARAASPDIVQTVEQFTEPFTAAIPTQPPRTDRRPLALAALWFCGFACVVILRLRAWRGMRTAIRRSQPLDLGLPVEARLSSGVFEPGIVGLWRPTLLLPQGILERLTPSELEAVIAHELCHIRRRDNLFAAIHMLIEALFWFHPLVWWIGARLLDERERACDEYVLSQGNQPDIYADAILNVCKLYTESPLACVSGVTGADIRRRLEAIMSNQKVMGLNFAKKTILACSAIVAVAGPITTGLLVGQAPHLLAQSQPAPVESQPASREPIPVEEIQAAPPSNTSSSQMTASPRFDVVSIKRCNAESLPENSPANRGGAAGQSSNRLGFHCTAVMQLITMAYNWHVDASSPLYQPRYEGAPDWVMPGSGERYTIEAEAEGNPGQDAMRGPMLQAVLEDRFKLKIHREIRQIPAYELTAPNGAVKLRPFREGRCIPQSQLPPRDKILDGSATLPPADQICPVLIVRKGPNVTMTSDVMDMDNFAVFIKGEVDRPVINKTGIVGLFDLHLDFAPEVVNSRLASYIPSDDPPGPTVFTALQQQLGLKLVPAMGSHGFVIIDHIERPSEN